MPALFGNTQLYGCMLPGSYLTMQLRGCTMENQIEKQIEIAAPVTRVWQALTDSRQFGEWFLVKMEGPFVAGQPVAGQITHPGYEHVRMQIVVGMIKPETLFSFTWHPYAVDPKVDYSHEEPTLIEFRLQPTAGGTLLTVTESGFDKIPAQRRAEALLRNESGWAQQMKNIQTYVTKTS
jgi:uncharacterized protein YndB with AHSA1/START domain